MSVCDGHKRLSGRLPLRRGTTLLEVVVYLALLVLIGGALGRIALQVREYTSFSNAQLRSLKQRFAFFDVIRRDMLSASCDPAAWDAQNCIFEKKNIAPDGSIVISHVGFTPTKRLEGVYDFGRRVWVEKYSSRLCGQPVPMRWKLHRKHARIRGVWIETKPSVWYVRIRNGQL